MRDAVGGVQAWGCFAGCERFKKQEITPRPLTLDPRMSRGTYRKTGKRREKQTNKQTNKKEEKERKKERKKTPKP
jgi:hypothetical protein